MTSRETELKFFFLTIDLLILNLAISIVASISPNINNTSAVETSIYFLHGNLSWILTYFAFSKKNLYLRDGYFNRFRRTLKRTTIFILISAVLAFLLMPKAFSRSFLLEYTAVFFIGKLIFYWVLYSFLKYSREKGFHTNRVLIVGQNPTTLFLKKIIESNPMLGYKFVGFVSSNPNAQSDELGTKDQLSQLIDQHKIQMIFVSLSLFSEENSGKEYLRICNKKGVRLRFIPENQRWLKSRIDMESVGQLVMINPQQIPLDDINARFWKRSFDILFSSMVIMLLLSWLLPIIALIIKLSSKGPVFFVQKRTGINNKTFKCLKFRSMKINGEADLKQATAGDSRITKIGQFIRRTNIDELPQFLNVFIGQMSVVGPRPHMLKHTQQYSALIDHYLIRHYVKPGITGWAQVNGLRGETDQLWKMENRVKYDMEYIENWTFWWDLNIIRLTLIGNEAHMNAF